MCTLKDTLRWFEILDDLWVRWGQWASLEVRYDSRVE